MSENTCPVCQSEIDIDSDACPVCHFKLAGATQSFKPLTVEAPVSTEDSPMYRASLKMVRGPQTGAIYELNTEVTNIGRNPQCDIFLNDMTVSREHAEIVVQANAYIINDLQSYNGVWINNHAITQHALRPGDYVQIGKYDFVYDEVKSESGE